MGKIRYRVLREHPLVKNIKVYDPAFDAKSANLEGVFLTSTEPIPWNQFDAAFICTPNNVTADLCIEAIHKCRNVLCEKPPGRNWADFSRIREAADQVPDHRLVFGFNHRLHPSIQMAKTLLGEGGMGKILFIKGTYGKSGGRNYRQSWRNNGDISGGGILLDQGLHVLDIFISFLGPLKVKEALLCDSFWKCGVEDNAFVLLESETKVPAFLHSSATLWKHTFRIEIGCENGYLLATGFLSATGSYGREQLIIGRRQFEDETTALGNPREEIVHFDRDDSWETEVNEFITAIQERRAPKHGTLDQAGQVMEIIRDVYSRSPLNLEVGAKV